MRRGWTVLSAVTVVMLALAWTSPAAACSGGGQTRGLRESLEAPPFIVHGRVSRTDDAGKNFIFEVEQSLNGAAIPSRIVVSFIEPWMLIEERRGNWGSSNCSQTPPAVTPATELLIALTPRIDGTYGLWSTVLGWYVALPADDTLIRFTAPMETGRASEEFVVTRSELLVLITDLLGREATEPIDGREPFLNPILITTEPGSVYVIPVGQEHPVPLFVGQLNELTTFTMATCVSCCYDVPRSLDVLATPADVPPGGSIRPDIPPCMRLLNRHGYVEAKVVEEQGSAHIEVEIWSDTFNGQQVTVAPLRLRRTLNTVRPLSERNNYAIWSPDGRILAYADENRVWMWDVFTSSSIPRPIDISADEVLQFSATGRYLRVGSDGIRRWVDLVSGETLPDGAFSPVDTRFVAYGRPMQVRHLVPQDYPLETSVEFGGAIVHEAAWIDPDQVAVLMCINSVRDTCAVVNWVFDGALAFQTMPVPYDGYQFDVAADTGNLAVVGHDQTLLLRDGITGEHRLLELRDELDGDIVSLEWLPSVFYFRYAEGITRVRR